MKRFMKKNFMDFLRDTTKDGPFKNKSVNDTRLKIEQCLCEMAGFFSKPKEKLKHQEPLIFLRQKKYSQLFLLLYFRYLRKLVTDQLTKFFGNEWKKKNVASVISTEKRMINNIIGSKRILKELVTGSGMIQENEKSKKAAIITQGEGFLPVIQKKIGLNLAIKAYYVLAQLHTTHIQISLNQVVKTSSFKENATSIVVQDEIVLIENINETLSKNIWRQIKINDQVNYCILHKKENGLHKSFLFKDYNNVSKILKQHVTKIVSINTIT